jgi:hypothetical protein
VLTLSMSSIFFVLVFSSALTKLTGNCLCSARFPERASQRPKTAML